MPPSSGVDTALSEEGNTHLSGEGLAQKLKQEFALLLSRVGPPRPCHNFEELIRLTIARVENILTISLQGQAERHVCYPNPTGDHLPDSRTTFTDQMHSTILHDTTDSGSHFVIPQPSHCENMSLQHGVNAYENNLPNDGEYDEDRNDSGFHSGGVILQKHYDHNSNDDYDRLERNAQELAQCHFYHGSLSSQSARDLLWKKPTGTFIIRDSSDSRYLYSLSVKTERGATSVRILYNNGLFQFDSDERIRNILPQFESVLALVDFHVMVTQDGGNRSWRWEETSGKKNMRVTLTKPLRNSVPSLFHLARVKTNQCLENVHLPKLSVDKLKIKPELQEYLKQYPYRV